MRTFYVAIAGIFLFFFASCNKSESSSKKPLISYKVNGTTVSVEGDYVSQSGVSFIHVPAAGNLQEQYVLTAQSPDGTFLGFPILTANFSTGAYTTPINANAIMYGAAIHFNGQDYASGVAGDPSLLININVSGYSGGRANGTFSGKLARSLGTGPTGNTIFEYAIITEGKFENVKVK